MIRNHQSLHYHLPDVPTIGMDEKGVPRVAVQGASSYLKIAGRLSQTMCFLLHSADQGNSSQPSYGCDLNENKSSG
jgi:hypothetical protein